MTGEASELALAEVSKALLGRAHRLTAMRAVAQMPEHFTQHELGLLVPQLRQGVVSREVRTLVYLGLLERHPPGDEWRTRPLRRRPSASWALVRTLAAEAEALWIGPPTLRHHRQAQRA